MPEKSANILPRIGHGAAKVSSRWPDEPIMLKRPLHAGDFSIVEFVFSRRINLHVPRRRLIPRAASPRRSENSRYELDHKSGLYRRGSLGGISSGVSATLVSTSKLAAELRERRER